MIQSSVFETYYKHIKLQQDKINLIDAVLSYY